MNIYRVPQKRAIAAALLLALCLAVIAGCGNRTASDETGAASKSNDTKQTSAASATAAREGEQSAEVSIASADEPIGNRYEAAGITDPAGFDAMFEQVQAAVAADDRAKVASLALYPIRVNYSAEQSVQIKDAAQFIAQYDSIITQSVKEALRTQDKKELFVNAQGIMAGAGQMWFGGTVETPQKYGIIAVNP
ncbi:hypothetical protein PaecuDRAFT_4776 [Paenibacillus curdlanolyticus YK9]|uniref:Lipoprotein n=1 Tax=Paenibacillus curdlanolyticus YK9 TaxID=717606 RepID=E0IGI3_9BACL|nr:hypothetical protein [Paenibacillus curdlanolyticus]EFM08423.1 hypothetical protein PaecuDRAFT_4776 [Paenibacillus curdlanolyticus YK9]